MLRLSIRVEIKAGDNAAREENSDESFTRIEDYRTDIGAGNVGGDADICRGHRQRIARFGQLLDAQGG